MTQPYKPEDYWDNVADSITARTDIKIIAGDDEPYYRYKRKRFLDLLGSLDFSNKSVLEIGSGPGGNLDFIHAKGCKKITGADVSSHMISLAKELLRGKDIDIVKTNGTELPFADNTFDTVFTSTVLQHNTNEDNLRKLIGEICRVSGNEVLLFERIESKIKGHESNLGRPIAYYESFMREHGFTLKETKSLPLQASFYVCGFARKAFNKRSRKEGEPLSKFSLMFEQVTLPITKILDTIVPSNRDVMMLRFARSR